jgi:hypothetical protein
LTLRVHSDEHVFGLRFRASVDRVTAQGHALTRLHRAIERGPPPQIRAIVAELPRPPALEDALAICLAFLDREPETYPRAAARWASRFAIERGLTLTDSQLALAALASLPSEGARAGAEALIELAARYNLRRVDELLTTWLERRGVGT